MAIFTRNCVNFTPFYVPRPAGLTPSQYVNHYLLQGPESQPSVYLGPRGRRLKIKRSPLRGNAHWKVKLNPPCAVKTTITGADVLLNSHRYF